MADEPKREAQEHEPRDVKCLLRFTLHAFAPSGAGIGTAELWTDRSIRCAWLPEREDEMRKLIASAKEQLPGSSETTGEARWELFRTFLANSGVHAVEQKQQEIVFKAEIDMATGRMIGEARAADATEAPDSSLIQRVFAALRNVPAGANARTATAVEDALSVGDHPAAARAAIGHAGALFGPSLALLEALRRVDIPSLPDDVVADFVRERFVVAALNGDFGDAAVKDVQWLRAHAWSSFEDTERAQVRLFEGCAAAQAGRNEEAYAIWKELSKSQDAAARSWALKNMAHLLDDSDPEKLRLCERSADAFLEVGDRIAVARMALRQAKLVLVKHPERALAIVDEALLLFGATVGDRDIRGGLLHSRAVALLDMCRFDEAVECAKSAADLRAGIVGAEAERASSLSVAASCLRALGRLDESAVLEKEADGLIEASGRDDVVLDRAVAQLAQVYEEARALDLLGHARRLGSVRTEGILMVLIGSNKDAPHTERLRMLEDAIRLLGSTVGAEADLNIANMAIALELEKGEEPTRALTLWKNVVAKEPFNVQARLHTVALLEKLEKWEEAASFFAVERARFGDSADVLYGEGRALLRSGRAADAVGILHRAVGLYEDCDPMKATASECRDKALTQSSGQIVALPTAPPARVITRGAFHTALSQFATIIAGEKRSAFWRSAPGNERRWVENPERTAQNLLFVFLRAKFGDQALVLEEIAAGAGRLDQLVVCEGGFRAVLELKMLGSPGYSLTYALAGEEQILHYMDSRGVRVGFLVVFDGREAHGTGIQAVTVAGGNTIFTVFVDVRSTWKKRARSGTADG